MIRTKKMESIKLPDADEALAMLNDMAAQNPLCRARQIDKPLVLYGAGDLGRMARLFCDTLHIPFRCVVDAQANRYTDHPDWQGVSVVKPADVPLSDRSNCLLAICIATACYTDIAESLAGQGWADIVPFYDITEAFTDRYPIHNGWFAGKLDAEDLREIGQALHTWADDASRAHHLQFIAWHLLRQDLVFPGAPVNTQNRYFIPEITNALQDDEVFLDGGAHHGEVTFRFAELVKNRFSKIYATEPDPANMQIFSDKLRQGTDPSWQFIEPLECALGKETGSAGFAGGFGYASQLSPQGSSVVRIHTIDDLALPVTFVKLHLEGWEYDALLGGLKTFQQRRPLIAVTTYHNRNGLWRACALLMKQLTGYVFLLRLHAWMGTGCVLYALPQERFRPLEPAISDRLDDTKKIRS